MKKLICLVILALSGCAHVTPYGHGCRDGVKDLEPQLGALGAVLAGGDSLDRYCDAVEKNHTDKGKEPK